MSWKIFNLDSKGAFKKARKALRRTPCTRQLLHLHGSQKAKLRKRLKKLRQTFPDATIHATVTHKKGPPILAAFCFDGDPSIESIHPHDANELAAKAIGDLLLTCENGETHTLRQIRDAVERAMLISKTDRRGIITYANDLFQKTSGYDE